jgi:hypothetical protein
VPAEPRQVAAHEGKQRALHCSKLSLNKIALASEYFVPILRFATRLFRAIRAPRRGIHVAIRRADAMKVLDLHLPADGGCQAFTESQLLSRHGRA